MANDILGKVGKTYYNKGGSYDAPLPKLGSKKVVGDATYILVKFAYNQGIIRKGQGLYFDADFNAVKCSTWLLNAVATNDIDTTKLSDDDDYAYQFVQVGGSSDGVALELINGAPAVNNNFAMELLTSSANANGMFIRASAVNNIQVESLATSNVRLSVDYTNNISEITGTNVGLLDINIGDILEVNGGSHYAIAMKITNANHIAVAPSVGIGGGLLNVDNVALGKVVNAKDKKFGLLVYGDGTNAEGAQNSSRFTGTGTVNVSGTGSNTNVVGTGTDFDNEFDVGQEINVNGETRTIASITNNVFMDVNANFDAAATGQTIYGITRVVPAIIYGKQI